VEKEDNAMAESELAKSLIMDLEAKIGAGTKEIEFQVEFVDHIPQDRTGKRKSVSSELTVS
jgi:acyl-coenzyme A synthetase/AMP-(fatty) acid ligase